MVFVNYIYDMVVDIQFHKFHGRRFAGVLYVFLMRDTKHINSKVVRKLVRSCARTGVGSMHDEYTVWY